MLSPIELLKNGILNSNWELVCEAYKKLTGKTLVYDSNANKCCNLSLQEAMLKIADIIYAITTEAITNDIQNSNVISIIDNLMKIDNLTDVQSNYMKFLSKLVEKYESSRYIESVNTETESSKKMSIMKKALRKKKPGRPKIKKKNIKDNNEEDDTIIISGEINTPASPNTTGVRFITNEPIEEEIEANKIKAKRAEKNKLKIKKDKPILEFDAICNECDKTFKSHRPDGDIGQKCSECLRNKKRQ